MKYIWQDYDPNNKFTVAKTFAPNIEMRGKEVNVTCRFEDIFSPLEYSNEEFSNLVLHFLANMDFIRSIYKNDILKQVLKNEIELGLYGEVVRYCFEKLETDLQAIILNYMLEDYKNQYKVCLFNQISKELFNERDIIYQKSNDVFILRIGDKKTEHTECIEKLLVELFWDITKQLEVIYSLPLGVIDINMDIEHFAIY